MKAASGLSLVASLAGSIQTAEVRPAEVRDDSSTYRLARVPADAKAGLGSWIWADKTFDHQNCRLWKGFEIPGGAKVVQAKLRMAVDDGYQLYLDGRELAQAANWRAITEYDLSLLLTPGRHVLAVDAFNDYLSAGMILELRVSLGDGRELDFKSDESWLVVPDTVREWEKLTRPEPTWPAATLIGLNAYWASPQWPEDYIRVPPFHPLVVPFWQTGWFQAVLVLASGTGLFVCLVLLFQLTLKSKEQRLLNQERSRIARDIHDDFGTRLTRLILEGELAQNGLAADAKTGARLTRINDGLREALGAMDEVLWAVNPQRDTVRDFVTYLCEYAQAYLQPAGIQCLLEIEPDMPPLDFELPLRRSLLLAVKEAITNVARHSQAEQLVLGINLKDGSLVVVVEDNGKGFDPRQPSGRNGLGNMIQRMKEVEGNCRIVSAPGAGCRIEFTIPLARRRPRFGSLMRGLGRMLGLGAAPAPAKPPTKTV